MIFSNLSTFLCLCYCWVCFRRQRPVSLVWDYNVAIISLVRCNLVEFINCPEEQVTNLDVFKCTLQSIVLFFFLLHPCQLVYLMNKALHFNRPWIIIRTTVERAKLTFTGVYLTSGHSLLSTQLSESQSCCLGKILCK